MAVVTESELLRVFNRISNWGRWGPDDEIGTLNLITPQVVQRAAEAIGVGVTVGCGELNMSGPEPNRSRYDHQMLSVGQDDAHGYAAGTDFIGVAYHGSLHTHLDALCHVFFDGQMYNGRPSSLVTNRGAQAGAVTAMRDGIVTRGLLVDVPAYRGVPYIEPEDPIQPADLTGALARQGCEVQPGDALVVYVGRERRRRAEGIGSEFRDGGRHLAGPSAMCLPWFREHDVSLLMSDGGNEAQPGPIGRATFPIHIGTIVFLGLPLIDNASLGRLTATCREHNKWDFLLSVGALPIAGGTGSPINPIAVV